MRFRSIVVRQLKWVSNFGQRPVEALRFYNEKRPHQSLICQAPAEVYHTGLIPGRISRFQIMTPI